MKTLRQSLTRRQFRQIALITAVAIGLFVLVRWLPTGTNLGHMDFRIAGGNSVEFCDPANPQFLPVVAVPSPVSMTLTAATAKRGQAQAFVLTLRTVTGKPIGPDDLAVAHTRKLHLLLVDPSLRDYQHLHPEPGDVVGEWTFSLTPHRSGLYRVFADFVPMATGRGLYAVAEFTVPGVPDGAAGFVPANLASDRMAGVKSAPPREDELDRSEPWGVPDGYRFTLSTSPAELRPREMLDLTLAIERVDGGAVLLGPVMGAFAHLVAFDQQRLGFAHLHPNETDITRPPDAVHPRLTFKVTLPQAGVYVVWAQVNLEGREVFAPFKLPVQ